METTILDTINAQELGKQLQEARKQRGLTQAEAAEIIEVSRTTITALEKGERRVKANELVELARAYGRQVGDFVHPRPMIDSFQVQFRSSYKRTMEDDQRIVKHIDEFEDLCRDYLELEKITQSPFPHRYPPEYQMDGVPVEQAAESLAQEERNRLGIGDGPVPILRDILEQEVGIRIFYIPMEPSNKFSAMYIYNEQLGGCIAVNSYHPEERRRLSLAHDYAHFLAHRHKSTVLVEGMYQRQPESERFADHFAYHFLMPSGSLTRRFNRIKQIQNRVTPGDLCTLANYYGVAVEALTRRLEDLRLLPTGLWDSLKERGFKVQETQKALALKPIHAYDGVFPKRYAYLAVRAYEEALITEGQFAKFLRVSRLEAREMAEQMVEQSQDLLDDGALEYRLIPSETA